MTSIVRLFIVGKLFREGRGLLIFGGDANQVNKAQRGFTLIEILIALTLLGISVAVLAQLISTNLRNISSSQNYVPAVVEAEARMSEIMASDFLEENKLNYKTDEGYVIDVLISEIMKDRFQNLPFKFMEISLTMRWNMAEKEKKFILRSTKTVKRSVTQEADKQENQDNQENQGQKEEEASSQ